MLKINECLDIEIIKQMRELCGRQLDEYDNLSWHIVLISEDDVLGTARLFNFNNEKALDLLNKEFKTDMIKYSKEEIEEILNLKRNFIYVDKPCLKVAIKEFNEMLFRTLLLKCTEMQAIVCTDELADYYLQFGFKQAGGLMFVRSEDINFPKLCGGHKQT